MCGLRSESWLGESSLWVFRAANVMDWTPWRAVSGLPAPPPIWAHIQVSWRLQNRHPSSSPLHFGNPLPTKTRERLVLQLNQPDRRVSAVSRSALTVSSEHMEWTWVPNMTAVKMRKRRPSKQRRMRRTTVAGGEKLLHSEEEEQHLDIKLIRWRSKVCRWGLSATTFSSHRYSVSFYWLYYDHKFTKWELWSQIYKDLNPNKTNLRWNIGGKIKTNNNYINFMQF